MSERSERQRKQPDSKRDQRIKVTMTCGDCGANWHYFTISSYTPEASRFVRCATCASYKWARESAGRQQVMPTNRSGGNDD